MKSNIRAQIYMFVHTEGQRSNYYITLLYYRFQVITRVVNPNQECHPAALSENTAVSSGVSSWCHVGVWRHRNKHSGMGSKCVFEKKCVAISPSAGAHVGERKAVVAKCHPAGLSAKYRVSVRNFGYFRYAAIDLMCMCPENARMALWCGLGLLGIGCSLWRRCQAAVAEARLKSIGADCVQECQRRERLQGDGEGEREDDRSGELGPRVHLPRGPVVG